jgi:arylsulfatase A-like enzyme
VENTGPLTMKRMETVDEEFLKATLDFIDRANKASKPFFVWFNTTRMHIWTHLKPASKGKTGLGVYADGMVETDGHVGQLLKKLEDLKIANNTIVIYTTDNGAEVMTWPDGGMTPFKGEKDTNWEGGFRVPCVIRWPGVIEPGTIINEVTSAEDWLPTLLAAAGVPDVKEKLLKGYRAGAKNFKVHLDGYNLLPAFKGEAKQWPRKEFVYFSDDGVLMAMRYNRWKFVFAEQRAKGMNVWSEPLVMMRIPTLYDLRADPFERAPEESSYYRDWAIRKLFIIVPAQEGMAKYLESFKEFPPRQKPASYTIDQVMEMMMKGMGGSK